MKKARYQMHSKQAKATRNLCPNRLVFVSLSLSEHLPTLQAQEAFPRFRPGLGKYVITAETTTKSNIYNRQGTIPAITTQQSLHSQVQEIGGR